MHPYITCSIYFSYVIAVIEESVKHFCWLKHNPSLYTWHWYCSVLRGQFAFQFFPPIFEFPLADKRFLILLYCIVLKIRVFRLVFPFSALKPLIRYFQEPHTVPSMSPFCILHISVLQQTWKTCISGSPYSLNHHRGSNNGHTYNRIIAASP